MVVTIGHLGRTGVEKMWSLKAASRRSLVDRNSDENGRVKPMICKIHRHSRVLFFLEWYLLKLLGTRCQSVGGKWCMSQKMVS